MCSEVSEEWNSGSEISLSFSFTVSISTGLNKGTPTWKASSDSGGLHWCGNLLIADTHGFLGVLDPHCSAAVSPLDPKNPTPNPSFTCDIFSHGKDWRQKEKRATENEMVGWHHQCYGHEIKQAPWDGEGQGSLVCCSLWGLKELDTTEQLNNNNNIKLFVASKYIDI